MATMRWWRQHAETTIYLHGVGRRYGGDDPAALPCRGQAQAATNTSVGHPERRLKCQVAERVISPFGLAS